MQRRDAAIRHHDRPLLRQYRRQQRSGARQQILADDDVVTAAHQSDFQAARELQGMQRRLQPVGGFVQRLVAGIDDQVGLGIDGMALVNQALQHGGGVVGHQQRAMRPPGHPSQQQRQWGPQPDGQPPVADRGASRQSMKAPPPVARTTGGPSSRRRITRRSTSRKAGSPNCSKILGDAATGRCLDLVVGIDERQAKARRELPANGGLPSAHQAHQHDAGARVGGGSRSLIGIQ